MAALSREGLLLASTPALRSYARTASLLFATLVIDAEILIGIRHRAAE